jgi:CRP-like cAMP-binding protein
MSQELLDLVVRSEPSRAGLRDRVLLLRAVENFTGLDEDGLTLLAEHARSRAFRKGEVIMEAGGPARSIHIIVEGQVTLTRKRSPLVMRDGSSFGVLSVIAGAPTARVVADVDTRTLEIPAAAFNIAIEENFSMLRNALRQIGLTLLRARGRLPADPRNAPAVNIGTYFPRTKTLAQRLMELRTGPYATMNLDALVDLARRMVEWRVPAGHVFWSVDEPSNFALHVDYGRVRCTAADGSSMDVGSNFTLGVMDSWASTPRSYAARAETDLIGYRIADEDFFSIMEMHNEVGLDMLRNIARDIVDND